MNMYSNKKATVIVYTLILVNLILIMAVVVLNNTFVLELNYKYQENNKLLSDAIKSKAKLSMKYAAYLNSNGSGFTDIISCPDSVTMSGQTLKSTGIMTELRYQTGSVFCEGSYNSLPFYVYFDSDFTDFISSKYQNYSVNLQAGGDKTGLTTFGDSDSTLISFLGTSYQKSDGIDDNFNSDNYNANSTGSLLYPDGYQDDDDKSKKLVYGYLTENSDYKNIFWNNKKMEAYIDSNENNNGYESLSGSIGHIYLDIDKAFALKISRFDKHQYDTYNELFLLNEQKREDLTAGLGYIQDDLSLSATKTGNEYVFDFSSYDYAIFLKNTGSGVLLYKLTGENLSGTGLYINPIGDADPSVMKYFGGEIIQGDDGIYSSKQFEVIEKK